MLSAAGALQGLMSLLALLSAAAATSCVDLVADCGAKADGSSDDTAAFAACQRLAAQRDGCITAPPRHFRCMGVALNTSHISWRVAAGAVFSPSSDMLKSGSMFTVGAQGHHGDANLYENISIVGEWPGKFTVDVSTPLAGKLAGQRQGAFMFVGLLSGFELHNLRVQLPGALNDGVANALEFNIAMGNRSLSPSHGRISNITALGGSWGYGLAQIQSGNHLHFANLDGTGGVTLRLETGIGGGYVGDITGTNITCTNGFAAFMAEPHCQMNGKFTLQGLRSNGCSVAVLANGGYVDEERHPGLPAGMFSNDSSASDVVGYFGRTSQPEAGIVNWPACSVVGNEDSPLNWIINLEGISAHGFPPPADRTKIVHWERWEKTHCYYNNTAGT